LFWNAGSDTLSAHVSAQFREMLEDELNTVEPHLDEYAVDGGNVAVLDSDAFAHRYEFPPTNLLIDALHRDRTQEQSDVGTIGVDEDTIRIRSTSELDLRDVAREIREETDQSGTRAIGSDPDQGEIKFLKGERDRVVAATVDAVARRL
ncbi:MAG: DNA-binding protein, partial [Halobacteriaceae archaeon]